MTPRFWLKLIPSLVLGTGIVAATFIITQPRESDWSLLAGPMLLSIAILVADGLASRIYGKSRGPSEATYFMTGALMLASGILSVRAPQHIGTLIPFIGAASWVVLLMRREKSHQACDSQS